jgi:hypothetical protein
VRQAIRCEVWTDLACNSGTAKGVLPVAGTFRVVEEFLGYLVSQKLSVTVPRSWADRAELVGRRILRVVYDDGTWDEFRIASVMDSVGRDDLVLVEALGIVYDLATGDTLVGTTTSGAVALATSDTAITPTTALTNRVDAHLPAIWSVGTVTPTATIELTTSRATPLAAALTIAELANKTAGTVATPYRISARRNGTTGYYVDLTDYNGSATTLDLRTGGAMAAVTRKLDTADMATRVYPLGSDGNHCGSAIWQVSAVSLNTYVEVVDVAGGPGPVQETDQFDNLYLRKAGGGTQQITGSSRQSLGTSRFTVAATAGFTVGDYVRIVADSSETDLPYVDAVANKSTYGVKVGVLQAGYPAATNLLKNADLRTGSPPSDWTGSGAGADTIDTTVGNWLTGGRAVKLTSASRVYEQSVTVQVPASGDWYAVYLIVFKGDPTSAAGTVQMGAYVDGVEISSALNVDGVAYFDGTWQYVYRSTKLVAGSRALKVSISMGRVMWWDAGAIFVTPGSAIQHPFMVGSYAARLTQDANDYLALYSAPVATYAVDCLDLFRVNGTAWPYAQIALGQPATVTEPDLAISATGLRIVRVETNHLVSHDAKLTLATPRPRLTNTLARAA